MAKKRGGAKRSAPSWRQGDTGQPEVRRYRWQTRDVVEVYQHLAQRRRLRRRIAFWFAATLGLLALLVVSLLFRPAKTPVIMIVGTDYDWPIAPQAWSVEDAIGLQSLDGQSLDVADISRTWRRSGRSLEALQQQLIAMRHAALHSKVAVVYLSLHGAVNENGAPCLIVPGASPHDSRQWIRLEDVLRTVGDNLPDEVHKLVVLDCQRTRINWNLGIVANTFASRLEEAVERVGVANLTVLSAAGPGQRAWSSPQLRGSVFGHYFRLGMAGLADAEWGTEPAQSGNSDGRVSLQELHRYLQWHVDRWARHHCAEPQTPTLIANQSREFFIAWSLGRRHRRALEEEANSPAPWQPPVSPEQVAELWKELQRLEPELQPRHFAPLAWRDLEHSLIWLEMLCRAGEGYSEKAQHVHDRLSSRLKSLAEAAATRGHSLAITSHPLLEQLPLPGAVAGRTIHALPLGQYLGLVDASAVGEAEATIRRLAESPATAELERVLGDRIGGQEGRLFSEFHLLHIADSAQVAQVWNRSDVLASLSELYGRAVWHGIPATPERRIGDERAWYWSRPALYAADQARRSAEDAVLAGPLPSGSDAAQQIREAGELYQRAEQVAAEARQAFALYDRVWAELPYLARWYARPFIASPAAAEPSATRPSPAAESPPAGVPLAQPDGELSPEAAADELVTGLIERMIRSAHQLGRQLADFAAATDAAADVTAPFAETSKRLAEDLDAASERFRDRWGDLIEEDELRASDLRTIADVLETPLVPWDKRLALQRQMAKGEAELSKNFSASDDESQNQSRGRSPEPQPPAMPTLPAYFQRINAWPVHPLVALLELDPSAPDGPSDPLTPLERIGHAVRSRLAVLAGAIPEQPQASESTAVAFRKPLSDRAHAVRSASGLWFPAPAPNPIAQLLRVDLQQLLIWHAERSIHDSWGPEVVADIAGRHTDYFFAVAADNYLDLAEEIIPPSAEVRQQMDQVRRAALQRKQAFRDGPEAWAEAPPRLDSSAPLRVTVRLRGTESSNQLPSGRASLWIRNKGQRVRGVDVAGSDALELPLEPNQVRQVVMRAEPGLQLPPNLETVLLFRGHEFVAPLLLPTLQGVTVALEPYTYGPPRVTLVGQRRQRPAIMFVLDCSDSMRRPVPGETPGEDEETRLKAAQDALIGMLEALAARGDARVGVRFFGHRLGWSKTQPVRVLANPQYEGEIPDELAPSDDVELVLPLGRFDTIEAGRVIRLLSSVEPWGQSPLYRALIEALGDFTSDDPGTDKSIVVITDGANYVFTPPGSDGREPLSPSVANVLSAWESQRVPIHILGFGMTAGEAEEAEPEFLRIAQGTGGSYYSVRSSAELLRRLEGRLGLGGYTVLDSARQPVVGSASGPGGLVPLNTPVVLPLPGSQPASYTAVFQSASQTFQVEGGEWLKMEVSSDGSAMYTLPYDGDFPVVEQLEMSGRQTGFVVRAHRPKRQGDDVRFPISIQHDSGGFTSRPAEIWVEVTPVGSDGERTESTYIFYDPNYRPDEPVPVLDCTAQRWPADAHQARIRFWCRPIATAPQQTLRLVDVVASPAAHNNGVAVAGVSGVTLSTRVEAGQGTGAYEVRVVERHTEASPGVGTLHVSMVLPSGVQPSFISHQFDRQNGVVVHTFRFAATARERLETSPDTAIQIRHRSAIQDGAWQLPDRRPMTVDIYDAANVLPLDAPQARRSR